MFIVTKSDKKYAFVSRVFQEVKKIKPPCRIILSARSSLLMNILVKGIWSHIHIVRIILKFLNFVLTYSIFNKLTVFERFHSEVIIGLNAVCRACEACKSQLIERFSHKICNRSDYSEYYRSQSLNSDILYLGPKDSSHCVHQQLLLLANHLPVHQLHVGVLVIQQLHQILFQPEPGPNPETCAVDVQLG